LATLLSLFALAAFFASNNSLGSDQTDAFLNWVIKQEYAPFLIWFMKIQTPTVHAFANVILESAIRIKNVQVFETLIASGIKLDNKLYEIASIGDVSLTERILFNADPACLTTTRLGVDLFHKFVSDRQHGLAQFLLDIGVSVDARWTRPIGAREPAYVFFRTALYLAVARQDIEGTRFLLDAGASVDLENHAGHPAAPKCRHTALGYAVYNNLTQIVVLLLEYNADVFAKLLGMPVLHWAAAHRKAFFELLKKKVEPGEIGFLLADLLDAADRGGDALAVYIANQTKGVTAHQLEQALEQSIIGDRFMAATTLLQHGVNPNGPTLRVHPLKTALDYNDIYDGFAELLLQYQAGVEHAQLLENLAETGEQRLLKMFLDRPGQIDVGQRERALVIACSGSDGGEGDWGNIPSIATIIDSKLDINTPGLPRNPLQGAAANKDEATVLFLISRGANVNAPPYPRGGRTALQAALETCNTDRIPRLLLHYGADASAPPAAFDGLTALEAFCHNAAAKDSPELCDTLLSAGATVNRPGGKPSSVLHGVIKRGWHELLRRSLGPPHNAVIDHMWCDTSWYTPTQLAASLGDVEALKLLLDHGADVNEAPANESGRTALQAASLLMPGPKKTALIQLLLEHGANINADAALIGGITALQGAAIAGDLMLARLLISLGADVNAWPSFRGGRTAVEAAAEHGRLDMVQLLLNAGATGDIMHGTGHKCAIKLAEENGYFAVAGLLK
jgi:ankyrin repeat protein